MDGDVLYRRLGEWTSFDLHLPLVVGAAQHDTSGADDLADRIARPHAG